MQQGASADDSCTYVDDIYTDNVELHLEMSR